MDLAGSWGMASMSDKRDSVKLAGCGLTGRPRLLDDRAPPVPPCSPTAQTRPRRPHDRDPDNTVLGNRVRIAWKIVQGMWPAIELLAGWSDADWQHLPQRRLDHWPRLTRRKEADDIRAVLDQIEFRW